MSSITSRLLGLHRSHFDAATRHPFLCQARDRTISKHRLERWLTQDRLYALTGYTRFLSGLILKIPVSTSGPATEESKLYRRRLAVLSGAMANIDREIGFFEQIAAENDLSLDFSPHADEADQALLGLLAPHTRGYIDYMVSIGTTATFEEGLILLWAMEKLYLEAWTFVASVRLGKKPATDSPASLKNALDHLEFNWSSIDFRDFVQNIEDLVNELPQHAVEWTKLEAVWKATLWFEERFWEAGEAWGNLEGDNPPSLERSDA